MSQNFINSGWCQFEFAQSHLKLLEDESFQLLLIAIEDPKLLKNMPRVIENYMKTRTYLAKYYKLFCEKLLYQMPKVKDIRHRVSSRDEELHLANTEL